MALGSRAPEPPRLVRDSGRVEHPVDGDGIRKLCRHCSAACESLRGRCGSAEDAACVVDKDEHGAVLCQEREGLSSAWVEAWRLSPQGGAREGEQDPERS